MSERSDATSGVLPQVTDSRISLRSSGLRHLNTPTHHHPHIPLLAIRDDRAVARHPRRVQLARGRDQDAAIAAAPLVRRFAPMPTFVSTANEGEDTHAVLPA